MKLIHYTHKEFQLEDRPYHQLLQVYQAKPVGFWVSVEGEYDWKWWCEAENFCLENLFVSYELELKKDANILYLNTPEEIKELSKKFPYKKRDKGYSLIPKLWDANEIDWFKLKENYQGIIITPYQWDCRLDEKCGWYYGWDCASGCIWDLNCISEMKLINSIECKKELVEL